MEQISAPKSYTQISTHNKWFKMNTILVTLISCLNISLELSSLEVHNFPTYFHEGYGQTKKRK